MIRGRGQDINHSGGKVGAETMGKRGAIATAGPIAMATQWARVWGSRLAVMARVEFGSRLRLTLSPTLALWKRRYGFVLSGWF